MRGLHDALSNSPNMSLAMLERAAIGDLVMRLVDGLATGDGSAPRHLMMNIADAAMKAARDTGSSETGQEKGGRPKIRMSGLGDSLG